MDRDIFGDFEKKQLKPPKSAIMIIIAIAVFIGILALNPFRTIGAGERGVVLNFGAVQPTVLNEGLHIIIPFMQNVIKMDVRVQKAETDAAASSRDLQEVSSTIAINYHIMPEESNKVYQSLGMQLKERIIDPSVQEVVKAVTAKYTAEELIAKRPEVSTKMKEDLSTRLSKHSVAIDEFSIVNFTFSKQFMEAIESKQTAEQFALRAERDLDRIKIEAEQKITQARAEAEALKLQKENISPDLIKLRQIEATLKAIDKWNGVMPKVTSSTLPFIDVEKLD